MSNLSPTPGCHNLTIKNPVCIKCNEYKTWYFKDLKMKKRKSSIFDMYDQRNFFEGASKGFSL